MNVLGIFTSFNRKQHTINSLDSLMKNKDINWYFVVADDNSSDGTYDVLSARENTYVIKGSGQLYYSGGMRLAIDHAIKSDLINNIDFVMLFNDDVTFYENSITRLINETNNRQSIFVGATEDEYGRLSYGGIKLCSKHKPKYKKIMSQNNNLLECDTFNANCVLIPKNVFIQLGNIDEHYIHSLGDFDYGLAAKRKGVKIYVCDFYVGKCELNTIVGTWLDSHNKRRDRIRLKENPKGQPGKIWFYYLRKNYNVFTALCYWINDYIKILLNL